jgi:hypothetical protein
MRAGTQMNSHNKHKPSRDESVGHEIDVRHVKEVGNGKQLFQDSRPQTESESEISAKSTTPVCLSCHQHYLGIVLYVQADNRAVQKHHFRR